MIRREWMLWHERMVISISCYPHHWAFHWRENGARAPQHCLDTTLAIGPWSFRLAIFRLGRLAWLIGWLPLPKHGRSGWHIGW